MIKLFLFYSHKDSNDIIIICNDVVVMIIYIAMTTEIS